MSRWVFCVPGQNSVANLAEMGLNGVMKRKACLSASTIRGWHLAGYFWPGALLLGATVALLAAGLGCGDSGTNASAGNGGKAGGGMGGNGGEGGLNLGGFGGDGGCDPADGQAACGAGSFCNDFSDVCAVQSTKGACSDTQNCEGRGPVCACDGTVYSTDCEAYTAGLDLAAMGCTAPTGTFFCQAFLCTSGQHACLHDVGFSIRHECLPLPDACKPMNGNPVDCSCLSNFGCACSQDADGHFILQCTND